MAPSRRAETPIERHVWVVAGVVILGMIMSILDTTIVNVALATLARDLHSGVAAVQWVITGYMLALGATIPLTGWAARRFGAKPTYMVSLVLFTVGSAACGDDHHGGSRRPAADGPRDGRRLDAGDDRADSRARARRRDRPEPALVLDLLRQRPGRRPRAGDGGADAAPHRLRRGGAARSERIAAAIQRPRRLHLRHQRTGRRRADRLAEGAARRAAGAGADGRLPGELLARGATAAGSSPLPLAHLQRRGLHDTGGKRCAVWRDDPDPPLLPGGARRLGDRRRAAHRAPGPWRAGGDAAGRKDLRTARRREGGGRRRAPALHIDGAARLPGRAHLAGVHLSDPPRARTLDRSVLHARDDRRLRRAAPRAGLRRKPSAQRPAADRRRGGHGDRRGGACGRLAAGAHPGGAGSRLRQDLLGRARDRGALASARPAAAARRASRCARALRGRAAPAGGAGGRRALILPSASLCYSRSVPHVPPRTRGATGRAMSSRMETSAT